MQEILAIFAAEMPERVDQIQRCWREQDLEGLKRVAHQLKGSAAGYGYPDIGTAAGNVEATLSSMIDGRVCVSLEELRHQLDELSELCNQVSPPQQKG